LCAGQGKGEKWGREVVLAVATSLSGIAIDSDGIRIVGIPEEIDVRVSF
jgi:hypothetical protein